MKRLKIYIAVAVLLVVSSGIKAQINPDGNTLNLSDDPIAAMLDSLVRLKYFEKNSIKTIAPRTAKYKYSPDSIPQFDDMVYESRLAKLDAISPFDLQYNPVVKGYIDLYTVRRRELVQRMLGLTMLYFPLFEEKLDKYGLPLEFKHLAIVESAMNPNAKSHAGAMGLWQFMYPTGKMYNLNVNSYVDDRCDIYKATEAACQHFKDLYELFGDWQLVLAAYNSGSGNVSKAIRRSGGKTTYWEIRPFLPKETQGYVPAFIAVNYVMNYATEHNLYAYTPKKTFYELDTVAIKQQVSFSQISAVLDVPIEEIQFLNPTYKKNVIPYTGKELYKLCLPASKIGSFINNELAIYNYLKKDTIESRKILASQEVKKTHTVVKGEHLNTIAKRYGCTAYDIKTWNNMKSTAVRPGQKLTVYVSKKTSASALVALKAKPEVNTVTVATEGNIKYKYHTIQKGDTLWTIAQSNGISIEQLKKLNNFGKKYMLMPGKKIKVGTAV